MKTINTNNAPAAVGPYSQAIVDEGTVYCSGQVSIDPVSGEIISGSTAEQTKIVLENLKAVIEGAGSDFEHVVKVNVYLRNYKDFDDMNRVYCEYFAHHKPARIAVEVGDIFGGLSIEIDAIARVIKK